MTRLEQKQRCLANIKRKMQLLSREQLCLKSDMDFLTKMLRRSSRLRQIIQAGLLFEEAGILDYYNREMVLEALKGLKEKREVCNGETAGGQ